MWARKLPVTGRVKMHTLDHVGTTCLTHLSTTMIIQAKVQCTLPLILSSGVEPESSTMEK